MLPIHEREMGAEPVRPRHNKALRRCMCAGTRRGGLKNPHLSPKLLFFFAGCQTACLGSLQSVLKKKPCTLRARRDPPLHGCFIPPSLWRCVTSTRSVAGTGKHNFDGESAAAFFFFPSKVRVFHLLIELHVQKEVHRDGAFHIKVISRGGRGDGRIMKTKGCRQ